MTEQNIREQIRMYHNPDAWKNTMVWSVWEDGEITLEKGGELFGQRTLHCMVPGLDKTIPRDWMPVVETQHGRAYCNNESDCKAVRNLIADF